MKSSDFKRKVPIVFYYTKTQMLLGWLSELLRIINIILQILCSSYVTRKSFFLLFTSQFSTDFIPCFHILLQNFFSPFVDHFFHITTFISIKYILVKMHLFKLNAVSYELVNDHRL